MNGKMREHQIIINLKPEHYQELERQARVGGAKSVSVFAKEQILRSLGIAGRTDDIVLPSSPDVASVTADIRRLHQELQIFIAESLAERDFGYIATPHQQETVSVLITAAAPGIHAASKEPPIDGTAVVDSNDVPVTITQSLPVVGAKSDGAKAQTEQAALLDSLEPAGLRVDEEKTTQSAPTGVSTLKLADGSRQHRQMKMNEALQQTSNSNLKQ
jgi:hypothetical protein